MIGIHGQALVDRETGEWLLDLRAPHFDLVQGGDRVLSALVAERHYADEQILFWTKHKEKANRVLLSRMREGDAYEYRGRRYSYVAPQRRVRRFDARQFARKVGQLEPTVEDLLGIVGAANTYDQERLYRAGKDYPELYVEACEWEETVAGVRGSVVGPREEKRGTSEGEE